MTGIRMRQSQLDKTMISIKTYFAVPFLLLAFFAKEFQFQLCDCVCGVRGRFTRIVGGIEANPHEHPWAIALIKNNVIYCGATVVSKNYLLTAAHCIYNFSPKDIQAYAGGHRVLEDKSDVKFVEAILHHELFDVVTFNNDIGLIKISEPLTYGPNVQPVCLPNKKGAFDYTGQLGLVSGWGRIGENKQSSSVLQYINIPIWPPKKCLASGYGPKRLSSNMMCAGFQEGIFDACQGDSGGSMLRTTPSGSFEVIGIISWGRGCARPNFPGVYTIVANYMPWIDQFLSSECLCSKRTTKIIT